YVKFMVERFGLLVRCNPKHWKWWEKIPADGSIAEIEWTCRLKSGSVPLGTPVFLLGTGGSGFIAVGETASDIRMTSGDMDNSWTHGHEHRGGEAMRIKLKLQRNQMDENSLRKSPFAYLIRRQSTFSWLSDEESIGLEAILD
ncbi:MAG: hypothetical protein VYB86_01030, partial [Candidatus Thermoplasmatota archaeon]|nr:hypothetical protein [Candidatus Thermoplasmatota archaeon]